MMVRPLAVACLACAAMGEAFAPLALAPGRAPPTGLRAARASCAAEPVSRRSAMAHILKSPLHGGCNLVNTLGR